MAYEWTGGINICFWTLSQILTISTKFRTSFRWDNAISIKFRTSFRWDNAIVLNLELASDGIMLWVLNLELSSDGINTGQVQIYYTQHLSFLNNAP